MIKYEMTASVSPEAWQLMNIYSNTDQIGKVPRYWFGDCLFVFLKKNKKQPVPVSA